MTTFSGIDIGRTGVGFASYWLENLAHNIANVNTIRPPGEEPFRARHVVAETLGAGLGASGSGVGVRDVLDDGRDPAQVSDPGHPLADEDGVVTMPVVDLAGQLGDMILAQRTYQANLKTVQTAHEAYQSALRMGQR